MAIVRFQSTVWNTPARQDLFRYAVAELMLNVPARYRIGPGAGQEWSVFSDTRITLDQVGALGALAAFDLDDLPNGWELPDDPETADRVAACEQIQELIEATWVPADQVNTNVDNPWQAVLDANDGPGIIKAESTTDPSWRPVAA